MAAEEGRRNSPERERDAGKPKEEEGANRKDGEGKKAGPRDGAKPAAVRGANSKDRKIFEAYDKDGDGDVTAKEMEAMMEGKQNSAGRRELRKAVKRADRNSDDGLNFEEFLFWYKVGRLDEKAENR
ncbi:MAG: EF-hand domain-containing protein [Verrucomicrobiales bacterium]